jgi:hypothetical protein
MSIITTDSTSTIINTQAPEVATLPQLPANTDACTTALYTSLSSAQAVLPANGSHVVVSAKKNNTKGGGVADGWEVHCVVPSFASSIDALGEWLETVNTVLLTQAKETLKQFRTNNAMASTIPLSLFTAAQLREDFLSGGDSGSYTKEEFERAFCASATWQRITTSDSFKVNAQYRTIAEVFKGKVVSLAGRSHGSLTDVDMDKMFAKLEESDLVTPFGAYFVKRIQKIRKDREENGSDVLDMDAL